MIQIYTQKEAAAVLKVHLNTIGIWIREGKLKSSKVGGSVRITEESINQMIKEGEKNA